MSCGKSPSLSGPVPANNKESILWERTTLNSKRFSLR